MSSTDSLFLVVGAGVFGASTALHLIRKYPTATVTLIDRAIPCQAGASWDWSKVVRADYANVLYMKMALEAMELWRTEPMYKPFYHESGLVWIDNRAFPRRVIDNHSHLNTDEKVRMATPEEVRKLYGGIFEDAEFDDMTEILINESSGWVQASKALNKVIDAALSAGVKSVETDIASLELDGEGSCVGVRSTSGQQFLAANVILATGARTAKLIADSAPDRADLQVGERFTAAAIFTGTVEVDAERAELFRTAPVFLYAFGRAQGASFPSTAENGLKVARDVSFQNTTIHSSGQLISMPPDEPDYAQWKLSQRIKDELGLVCEGIFGKKGGNFCLENYRICWDAITPNQDFIICPHPHCRNLFVATGGSFHAWKFLPILGKYVVQMLEGSLDPEMSSKWAWDRISKGTAHEQLVPRREMRDIM